MSVQPSDTEPEGQRATTADFRRDPWFTWPERAPWSELGPVFTDAWGRADPADPQPEHLEIFGQNGSGKSYTLCTMLQGMQVRRKTGSVIVCTKKADRVFAKLGWPVVASWDEVRRERNSIFWPQTRAMGLDRQAFYERKITELLEREWDAQAAAMKDGKHPKLIVAFDEIGYVENLSAAMKSLIQQYWRESRSLGITVAGMKQRPQGALRDMHSESYWTVAFKPKDRGDLERWAELFGARRDWMPVFDSLDRGRREFIIRNPVHEDAYISWIDVPLRPVKTRRRTPAWWRPGAA